MGTQRTGFNYFWLKSIFSENINLLLTDDMMKVQINVESDWLEYLCHAKSDKCHF